MFIFTSIANGTLSHCKSRILYFLEELLMKKTERTILALLMAAVCLLTLFATNAFAMTEEQAVNAGYDIFTAWHRQTYSNYHYMLYDYVSPYKSTIEKDESSAAYQSLLFAWRVANFNISSEISNADKEIAYYESFIFDMFYDEDSGSFFQTLIQNANSYNKSAEKELKSLGASVEKSIASALKAVEEEYTDGIPEGGWDVDKLERAYGIISRADEVKDACKIITNVTDFLGYAKTAGELLENICKIQAVLNSAEEIKSILEDLTSRTSFLSNPSMHTALVELQGYLENAFTQADFIPLIIGRTTVTEVSKELGKKAWGGVLECLFGAYGKAVQAGQSAGKFLADGLFNSSDSVAAYYKLRAAYFFEEELKSYIKSIESAALSNKETAKKFNTAVTMLYKAYISGMDIYQSYVEKTYREGLLNKIFPGVKDKAYEKLCDDLASIKRTIKSSYMVQEEIAEEVYNDFVEAYHYTPVPMQEEKEEYPETIALLEEKDYSFRNTISKDWTLNKDVVIYGDFTVTGGTLNLNGHTLTVYGDMIQTGGCVICNEGQLYIIGDYRIQTPKKNNDGEETCYDCSDGALKMTKDADKITVDGSFYTSSTQRYVGGDNTFSAGTITIGKNFYEYNNQYSSSNSNFNATGTHLVYFKGTGEHIVLFQGTSSGFAAVKADAKLIWSGYCNLTLQNDLTIKDNGITVRTIDLNGKVLTVDGNLIQNAGTIKCNGGTLHVTGDYRIQTPEKNANGEVTGYNTSDGSLQMTKATDKITVDGSFYTSSTQRYVGGDNAFSAGTITIGKNFYEYNNQYSSSNSNFNATGTHLVYFKGTGEHIVLFQGTSSGFAAVKADAKLIWSGYCNLTLQNDLTIKDNGITVRTIDLNGKVLTVDGNLIQNAGTIKCNGGTLHVTGDYRIQTPEKNANGEVTGYNTSDGSLQMTKATDKITVDGSFYTSSTQRYVGGDNAFSAGTITIGKNFYEYNNQYSSSNSNFNASGTHKVIIGGKGKHTVSFSGSGSHFSTLELTQGCGNYTFSPSKCWNAIVTASHADADHDGVCDVCATALPKLASITLSQTSVVYNGAVRSPSVTVKNAAGETLTKGTDYTLTIPTGRKIPDSYVYEAQGIGIYYGKVSATFTINKQALDSSRVTLSKSNFTYDGTVQKPSVTVKNVVGNAITEGSSYTLTWSADSKQPGAYTVTATGKGYYTGSVNKTYNILPGQVKNLKATTTAANQAVLSWTAVPGAEKYMIYTSSTAGGTFSSYAYCSGTTYTMNRTDAGKYYYKVRAYVTADSAKLYGPFSAAVRSTPGQVKNLKATTTAANQAVLSWSAVPGAEMYMIYTSATADGTFTAYDYISGTSYTMNRTNAGKYYYKVRAYVTADGAKLYGPYSTAVRSTPGQVKNLKATTTAANQAVLSWTAVPGAEKYMVYTSATENGTYSSYVMTASTSYTVKRSNADQLFYKVRAYVTANNIKQYGGYSAVARCVPGQVKNLKAVSTAANKVSLSWNAVPGAEMYMIYTATTANGTYSSYVMTANTSYMISRTNASKLYYKVRAYATVNGAKTYGAFSAAAQGLPGQVKNVKAVKVTANQAALTWDKVPGAEKYMVYYAASQNGTYTAYGMTASTSYIMNKTNAGAMYYKVRAFVTVDGAKQYGAFSTVVKAK